MPTQSLIDGYRKFREKYRSDHEVFDRLADEGQDPKVMWIGCSDSRVPANEIVGLEPGEVFVHRNVGNLVHRGDINLLSVLEYAVENLQVRDIIVCGHYGCGGVAAALDGHRHGIIDHWLQPIRDIADVAARELQELATQEDRLNRLCELSVRAQVGSLARTPIIRSVWQRGRELNIHGWVYGLSDGLIRDLDCSRSGLHEKIAATQ